jgi:hypothetical protein
MLEALKGAPANREEIAEKLAAYENAGRYEACRARRQVRRRGFPRPAKASPKRP